MRKLIGTIVLLGALGYAVIFMFGASLVGGVIEGATGTKASVQRVHLKLYPLEAGIYGTRLRNLEGFQEPEFISIPEIFIRIEPLGLLKGMLHVEKITLNLEHVTIEKTQGGKVNLKELMDRSKQKQKEAEAKTAEKPSGGDTGKTKPQPKVQIDEVDLSLGKLSFVDYAGGQRTVKNMDLKVDHQILHNVTDAFSLTQQVILIILKKVGFAALGIQVDIFKGSLEEQAGEFISQAKNKLSQIFN